MMHLCPYRLLFFSFYLSRKCRADEILSSLFATVPEYGTRVSSLERVNRHSMDEQTQWCSCLVEFQQHILSISETFSTKTVKISLFFLLGIVSLSRPKFWLD